MVTAIYSVGQIRGAELWIFFWFLCVIVYVGGCLLFRSNRSRHGVKSMLIALLIAEVVVDLVWAVIYYNHSVYLNYGIGATYGILLWLPALLIAAVIITIKYRRKAR